MKSYIISLLLVGFCLMTCINAFSNLEQTQESSISLSIDTKTPVNGGKNGEITIKITGGSAPYEIRCMGPDFNYKVANKTQFKLENLTNGDYLFIVRDQDGQIKHGKIQL